jgi:hypothetical protein
MRFPKRIPTLIGLLLVVFVVLSYAFLSNIFFQEQAKANLSYEPKNVLFSNVTDNSFTITWTTSDECSGLVLLTENGKTMTFSDERDSGGKTNKYFTHSINFHDLKSSTLYKLKIISNGKTYTDNGKEYISITASPLEQMTTGFDPAFGSVMTSDNKPANGAIVYLNLDGSQILSTLVNESGSWLIPLSQLRSTDLSGYLTKTQDRLNEQITVRYILDGSIATSDTLNDSPIPTMVIGKTYDFRRQQGINQPLKSLGAIIDSPENSNMKSVLGAQTINGKENSTTITQPADNATLVSNLPLFEGTGTPGKTVTLIIGKTNPINTTVTIKSDGIWRFVPTKPLSEGKQTLTVSTLNNSGKTVSITRTFDILKSGTQVLGDATPSGTLTPTPTTRTTPIVTSTITPSPRISITPTPTITLPTNTPIISPALESTLSGQPLEQTGTILPTLVLIILSLGLITGGGLLYFK